MKGEHRKQHVDEGVRPGMFREDPPSTSLQFLAWRRALDLTREADDDPFPEPEPEPHTSP